MLVGNAVKTWVTRAAGPDDWQDLKALLRTQRETKAAHVLGTTEEGLWGAICNQFSFPQVRVLVLYSGVSGAQGYAILCVTHPPDIYSPGATKGVKHLFISAVFVDPHLPREAGLAMMSGIEEFGKSWEVSLIYGNVRMEGPIKGFARKYGMKPMYVGIGKEL
jgi:hypothetical protein